MSTIPPPDKDHSRTPSFDELPADLLSCDVLNALDSQVAVIDSTGKIVAINDAWRNFALNNGSTLESTGAGCNSLSVRREALHPRNVESADGALQGIEKVLRREVAEFEYVYPCHFPDDVQRWFLMRCATLGKHAGYAMISHTDITEQKLAEKALRKREEELEAFHIIHRQVASQIELEPVIDTILVQIMQIMQPDLALLFLREGDALILKKIVPAYPTPFCSGRINPRVGKCFCGLAVQTATALFSYDITTDPRCVMNECKLSDYLSFACIPLVDGSDVLGCISLSSKQPRDFSTRSSFLTYAAQDITLSLKNALLYSRLQHFADDIQKQLQDRRRLEQILVHNQKLEAIGHLAGGIAHDFNNILAVIMGFSELALRKTEDVVCREYLQGGLKACHRAKDLIQQILVFGRKSNNHLMPLDLRYVLRETLPLIRASLPSTITVYDRLDSDCSATIRGNPSQLQRVFMNLCANAAHAMLDSGGILIVKLSLVKIDETVRESCPQLQLNSTYVELSVRDTGTGIEKEHLGSIFEPYYSTKVPGKGTGLGLAVVHGIMRDHNGGVTVRSFFNHGTTFSLYFPFYEAKVPAGTLEEKTASNQEGSAHILIVDDEEVIVEVLQKVLEGRGYTTTCCRHAKDALALFQKSPDSYDLVLCDLSMPEMSGDVLAKKIKRIRSDIPLILCTGHSSEQLHGIDGDSVDMILQKPIPQAELTSALREALLKKRTPRS
jgi:signal transduction histidine kinase/CheY-like chemotaxis protein